MSTPPHPLIPNKFNEAIARLEESWSRRVDNYKFAAVAFLEALEEIAEMKVAPEVKKVIDDAKGRVMVYLESAVKADEAHGQTNPK